MFGLDFVLDNDLNLWLTECHPSPQLVKGNQYKTEYFVTMMRDMLDIEVTLLRSRWQKVINFINLFQADIMKERMVKNAPAWRKKFADIYINDPKPQYVISSSNTWQPVINRNIRDQGAYFGLMDKDCIDDELYRESDSK